MGELAERQRVVDAMFHKYDRDARGELNVHEVQQMHAGIRMGGINIPQVNQKLMYFDIRLSLKPGLHVNPWL